MIGQVGPPIRSRLRMSRGKHHQRHQTTNRTLKPLWNKALLVGGQLVALVVHAARRRDGGRVLVVRQHATNAATNIDPPDSIGFAEGVGGLVALVSRSVRISDFWDLERGKR